MHLFRLTKVRVHLLCLVAAPCFADVPKSSLQVIIYRDPFALTLNTTLEEKQQSCREGHGAGAHLLDAKTTIQDDFDGDVDVFNHYLNSIYVRKPHTAFYCLYDGTDTPPQNENIRYVITTDPMILTTLGMVAEVGMAHVHSKNETAQLLCVVPNDFYAKDRHKFKHYILVPFVVSYIFTIALMGMAWEARQKWKYRELPNSTCTADDHDSSTSTEMPHYPGRVSMEEWNSSPPITSV